MANTQKPTASKIAVTNAEDVWANFTRYSKWSIIAVIIILIIMAMIFIDW